MSTSEVRSLAAVVAEQAGCAPRQSWVEAARSDRVVDRATLATITAAWRAQGLAGRRVGLHVGDPVAFGALFVSLVAAGATVVPLDADAPPEAVRRVLDGSRAEATVVTADDPLPVRVSREILASPTTLLPERPPRAGLVPATEGGALLLSSGSTGPRKAVRLAASQLLHVACAVAGAHELGPGDRGFNPLPLFHINGEVVGLLAPLVSGGTVVVDRSFHRSGFWPLMAQRFITWVNAVPAIVTILGQEPPGPSAPGSMRFVRSASAPLAEAVIERFERRYRVPVIESYGMTEAASQITASPLRGRRPGSVGVPVDVELRVVDESGTDSAPGHVGRVIIRGAGVIRRYEEGVGEDRFDADGWLNTGDLGARDEDGFLTLVGRDGEVINRSGEKIFPREVEDVLRGHRAVREAVVVGRADDVLGEVPVAYVLAAEGNPPDLVDQLTARCDASLPAAHRPVEINLVTLLPRGPTGKTARRLVAEQDKELVAAGDERRW
jgi:acyl-CoA synthetase (AMP-forming)/AMP-acid ligase II